jgi:Ni,Fe-hydrogenase III large subunit/Ni,Fe-hydrogenase III component G
LLPKPEKTYIFEALGNYYSTIEQIEKTEIRSTMEIIDEIRIKNNQSVLLKTVPVLSYDIFYNRVIALLKNKNNHCANYYAYKYQNVLKFICLIACDETHDIAVISHELNFLEITELKSLTEKIPALHIFEREIHENFGINFINHPWLKPVRFAHDRADKSLQIRDYPFFRIGGLETHEVGVGPIHAGVIEPGHFRFSCHGETVLHLEIQLGYQHRGIEKLMVDKNHLLARTMLAEGISGDSVIAHNLAFTGLMESLYGIEPNVRLDMLRTLALELERVSVHVGDLGNLAMDVAYQLGSAVFGVLRTPMINYTQLWCGNRFGKGLIRVGYNPFPFTKELQEKLIKVLEEFDFKYMEMSKKLFALPSVLNRFERCGVLSADQMTQIGAVGMAARITGLDRDIRTSHPFGYFQHLEYEPVLLSSGDVYARAQMRNVEILRSFQYIRTMLTQIYKLTEPEPQQMRSDLYHQTLKSSSLCVALTEGWRGEICHSVVTDEKGEIAHYKIKDPSFHNWFALALALRDNEISDFPVNNKSFDLSYCGFDL